MNIKKINKMNKDSIKNKKKLFKVKSTQKNFKNIGELKKKQEEFMFNINQLIQSFEIKPKELYFIEKLKKMNEHYYKNLENEIYIEKDINKKKFNFKQLKKLKKKKNSTNNELLIWNSDNEQKKIHVNYKFDKKEQFKLFDTFLKIIILSHKKKTKMKKYILLWKEKALQNKFKINKLFNKIKNNSKIKLLKAFFKLQSIKKFTKNNKKLNKIKYQSLPQTPKIYLNNKQTRSINNKTFFNKKTLKKKSLNKMLKEKITPFEFKIKKKNNNINKEKLKKSLILKILKNYKNYIKNRFILENKKNKLSSLLIIKFNLKLKNFFNKLVINNKLKKNKLLNKIFFKAELKIKKNNSLNCLKAINNLVKLKNRSKLLKCYAIKIVKTRKMKLFYSFRKLKKIINFKKKQMELMSIFIIKTQKFKLFQAYKRLLNKVNNDKKINLKIHLKNLFRNLRKNHLHQKTYVFNIWSKKDLKKKVYLFSEKMENYINKKKIKIYNHYKQIYYEYKVQKLFDGNQTLNKFLKKKDRQHKKKIYKKIFKKNGHWENKLIKKILAIHNGNEQIIFWNFFDFVRNKDPSIFKKKKDFLYKLK